MATSGQHAQETIRAKGSSKCSKHYGKEVIYVCENCEDLVCVNCVTHLQHKGHKLEGLSNVVSETKQKLEKFVERAEGREIPQIKEKLKNVDSELSKNKKQFKKQVSLIKERNETIKKELDNITDTMVKTCHGIEHQNSDKILNHQKKLQTQLNKLNLKIQEAKATLQCENDALVFDTSNMILEFESLPIPCWSTADFSHGKLALQQLEHLLGELNITDQYQPSLSLSQPATWRVMSEFTPFEGHRVDSMHAVDDKAWLSDFSKTMLSVNQTGQVQQTLDTDVCVKDFCISPQTGNIWYCSSEETRVREVKGSRDQIKFTIDTWPECICVTRDGHVLVGSTEQVDKYTQTGQKMCTTSGGTPPVVRFPRHISACPLTRNIAVVDWDCDEWEDIGEPFVSILNDQLQLLYTYRGEVSGQQPPPCPFVPQDACYIDTGELVIINRENKSVVLVTGTGRYLQTLYTDSESEPRAVSVHRGAIWVSMHTREVKVLKYN